MWIHKRKNWHDFIWNDKVIAYKLAEIRHQQGFLLGRMQELGFELKQEANLNTLTRDVIKSSAIEGENLNREEVRSSIARRLGIDIGGLVSTSRSVDGIVEVMLDATQKFSDPLTKTRLFNWQAALFPTGRSGMKQINQDPVNERQNNILNMMLKDDFKGYMNTSKYAKLAACSNDTALRDIQDLKARRILVQNEGGGRSTSYRLQKKSMDLLTL